MAKTSRRRGGSIPDAADYAAADRAKKSFLAAIGHELRTPLNAIIGFSEIIQAELFGPVDNDQYREYICHILSSARSLLSVIEDVLEISRAEAGELVLARKEVDLLLLVSKAKVKFDDQCALRNVIIDVQVPRDLIIRVDPIKFQRLLSILISNAIKFSDVGSRVSVSATLNLRDILVIRVEDEGIGIPPDEIDRVFDQFVQLDGELSRTFEGSGLGLPLAKVLTELHGGKVELQSELGVGTTAIVTLPAYASASMD